MSILSNAHNHVIHGGEFVGTQSIHNFGGPSGIDILLEASIPDAAVDADARQEAPSCFPGTREQYIKDISSWATSPDNDHPLPVYWMSGPAGVGKSAVAQTCAEKAKDVGYLGAAFFFSINGRDDHMRFFTSIAYQLSTVLPAYRSILNNVILNDKTLVKKTLSSQFTSLIVDPVQELRKQGKAIQKKVIFIDGLDECRDKDAQRKIIEIIATSARDQTTPFRWAIFSRAEYHISATFDIEQISPHCLRVSLPISHDHDGDIELYIRGEIENILRRRRLPRSSFPADDDVKALAKASKGLFAYPAAILRFISGTPSLQFSKTLEEILDAVFQRQTELNSEDSHPFAELDALYMIIMERIPANTLPRVQLLLAYSIAVFYAFRFAEETQWNVVSLRNALGISDFEFGAIQDCLHPVIDFSEPQNQFQVELSESGIHLTQSYLVQEGLQLGYSFQRSVSHSHGRMNFHHKSFYDFLVDPKRSLTFCVTTRAMYEKVFERLIRQHHHFAQSFSIQGVDLLLAQDVHSSSATLSCSLGNEFLDSYLHLSTLTGISYLFSLECLSRFCLWNNVSLNCLRKLADLDYRKALFANKLQRNSGSPAHTYFLNFSKTTFRGKDGTAYSCCESDKFKWINLEKFLEAIIKFKNLGIIKPYHPRFPSKLASAYHSVSRLRTRTRRHGLYKLGRGEKSVIWYWEFDTKKRYFHEFETVNFEEAMKIYEAEMFTIWKDFPSDPHSEVDSSNSDGADSGSVVSSNAKAESSNQAD